MKVDEIQSLEGLNQVTDPLRRGTGNCDTAKAMDVDAVLFKTRGIFSDMFPCRGSRYERQLESSKPLRHRRLQVDYENGNQV